MGAVHPIGARHEPRVARAHADQPRDPRARPDGVRRGGREPALLRAAHAGPDARLGHHPVALASCHRRRRVLDPRRPPRHAGPPPPTWCRAAARPRRLRGRSPDGHRGPDAARGLREDGRRGRDRRGLRELAAAGPPGSTRPSGCSPLHRGRFAPNYCARLPNPEAFPAECQENALPVESAIQKLPSPLE